MEKQRPVWLIASRGGFRRGPVVNLERKSSPSLFFFKLCAVPFPELPKV